MGDLISKSTTINLLRNYADLKFANGEPELSGGILKAVSYIKNDNIPTEYDVEKVIQQINNAIMPTPEHRHKFCGTVEPEHCVKYENCEDCMAERMIEIVKKGGV